MPVDHYENFPVASVLLPAKLRQPVALIYRYARTADDFADEGSRPDAERLALLDGYRDELRKIERGEASDDGMFQDLASLIGQHSLPITLFYDLLSAFTQDVTKKSYRDQIEVLDYCRRSANPIGRLLLHLFKQATPQNVLWSDKICSALQIINFLQDIAIDHAMGRVYMPADELARFGINTSQIATHDCGGRWREFIRSQIDTTRRMLWEGAPLGRALKGRMGLEIRMVVAGGDRILKKLLAADCDMFRRRPVLRAYDWPLMWLRTLAIR